MAGEKNTAAFGPQELESDGGTAARRMVGGRSWTGLAFVVESLILLFAIVVSMAVFTSLYAKAGTLATRSEDLTCAIQMAQSAAEEFSNDPAAVAQGSLVGLGYAAGEKNTNELAVTCTVDAQATNAGTLYRAHIVVVEAGDGAQAAAGDAADDAQAAEVFSLDATRYVSGVK